MSIKYDNNFKSGTVYCDGNLEECHGEAQFDGDFANVVEQAKTMGWKVTNSGGEWFHYCTACKGEK